MQINASTVALVTGGASGLGEATTRRLHRRGAAVVILDLPSSGGQDLATSSAIGSDFSPADVRDEDQVRAAIAAAAELGVLRIVVNCAGIGTPGRVVGRKGPLDLESFRNVVDINLVGTFNVLRLAAAAMLGNEPVDGDRGVIVMTASIAAYDGQIGQAAYAASKGGIVSLTLCGRTRPRGQAHPGRDRGAGDLRHTDARRAARRGDRRPGGPGAPSVPSRPTL